MIGPNLLHVVLLGFAAMCAYFTLGEMNHRSLRRQRLFAPVLFADACALVFLLFHLGTRQPQWVFGAALAAGLAIGTVRGFTLSLQIDHMFDRFACPGRAVRSSSRSRWWRPCCSRSAALSRAPPGRPSA